MQVQFANNGSAGHNPKITNGNQQWGKLSLNDCTYGVANWTVVCVYRDIIAVGRFLAREYN